MLNTNPCLESRFRNFFEFPDWAPAVCVDWLARNAKNENFAFEDFAEAKKHFLRGFKELLPLMGWGNARDVAQIWDDLN